MKRVFQFFKTEILCKTWKSVFVLAGLLTLNSCGENVQRMPADDAALIKSFFREHAELEGLFMKSPKTEKVKFFFDVYVDHSASIQGYLNFQSHSTKKSESGNTAPNFLNLLRQLSNRGELLGFNSFGTFGEAEPSTEEVITPLGQTHPAKAEVFKGHNNDYASLIRKIKTEQLQSSDGKPVQHMIITDGVQSHRDPGNGSALAKTVKELQGWIDSGGAVDIRVSTSPYTGKYYSEVLRALNANKKESIVTGSVSDRPFLIISLLQSPAHLESWQQFWSSSGLSTIPIAATASFPSPISEHTGFEMKIGSEVSKKMAPEMLFSKIWEHRQIVTIENASDLFAAQILRPQGLKNQISSHYPICIHIEGSGSDLDKNFKASKPLLQIWKSGPSKASQLKAHSSSDGKQQVANAPSRAWEELSKEEMAGLPTDLRETFDAEPSPLAKDENGVRFVLRAPLQSRGTDHIMLLTTEQIPGPPPPPDFAKFSCTDDSTSDALNRIYNLQQLVEQFSQGMLPVKQRSGVLILTHY